MTGISTSDMDQLLQAADAGKLEAIVRLGRIYGGLEGRDPEPEKAIVWLEKAGEAGHGPSLCDLGLHYSNGWGVTCDPSRAAALYERAAGAGETWGAYLLGLCFHEGEGVEKSADKALHWLDIAAPDHREARDMSYVIRFGSAD